MANRWSAQANLLISIIPGGTARQEIDGADVEYLFAQPALPPHHGIVIGAIVTRRNACISVQVDPAVIGNPQELEADLAGAFEEIRNNQPA